MIRRKSFKKDPSARLDYTWDLQHWLEEGEQVTDRTITADSGITVEARAAYLSIAPDGKSVSEWVKGGTDGTSYKITCHFVTSAGREDDDTITIRCVNK